MLTYKDVKLLRVGITLRCEGNVQFDNFDGNTRSYRTYPFPGGPRTTYLVGLVRRYEGHTEPGCRGYNTEWGYSEYEPPMWCPSKCHWVVQTKETLLSPIYEHLLEQVQLEQVHESGRNH